VHQAHQRAGRSPTASRTRTCAAAAPAGLQALSATVRPTRLQTAQRPLTHGITAARREQIQPTEPAEEPEPPSSASSLPGRATPNRSGGNPSQRGPRAARTALSLVTDRRQTPPRGCTARWRGRGHLVGHLRVCRQPGPCHGRITGPLAIAPAPPPAGPRLPWPGERVMPSGRGSSGGWALAGICPPSSTPAAWRPGDWPAFGETAYAGRYRQAIERTSSDHPTLRTMPGRPGSSRCPADGTRRASGITPRSPCSPSRNRISGCARPKSAGRRSSSPPSGARQPARAGAVRGRFLAVVVTRRQRPAIDERDEMLVIVVIHDARRRANGNDPVRRRVFRQAMSWSASSCLSPSPLRLAA
jgi:hypothetical protein